MSRRDVRVCDRQESQHAFGIRSGDEFITLSNFTLEYVCEVRAGVDSGFIVDVTLSNGPVTMDGIWGAFYSYVI